MLIAGGHLPPSCKSSSPCSLGLGPCDRSVPNCSSVDTTVASWFQKGFSSVVVMFVSSAAQGL